MMTMYDDFITGVLKFLRNFGQPNCMYRIQSLVIKTRGWIIQSTQKDPKRPKRNRKRPKQTEKEPERTHLDFLYIIKFKLRSYSRENDKCRSRRIQLEVFFSDVKPKIDISCFFFHFYLPTIPGTNI